nr:hypothetical protein CFP56_03266 [Quercus suber]
MIVARNSSVGSVCFATIATASTSITIASAALRPCSWPSWRVPRSPSSGWCLLLWGRGCSFVWRGFRRGTAIWRDVGGWPVWVARQKGGKNEVMITMTIMIVARNSSVGSVCFATIATASTSITIASAALRPCSWPSWRVPRSACSLPPSAHLALPAAPTMVSSAHRLSAAMPNARVPASGSWPSRTHAR